jgi:hypothetical protein
VEDHVAGEACQHVRRLLCSSPRVDHDGQSDFSCKCEVPLEKAPLSVTRRIVAIVIEPGLPHRHGPLVGKQLPELVQPPCVSRAGIVRVDAERRKDALLLAGKLERPPARVDAGADRDDAIDSRLPGTLENGGRRPVARVEVRVRVDQAAIRSTRGKSGGAGSMPRAGASPPARTPSQATSGS